MCFYAPVAAHVQWKAPLFLWIAASRQPATMRGRRQGCTDRVGTASQPPPLHFFPLAPTLFTFCSRHSQAEWLKASQKKKNLRFRIWFPLRLASSLVFLAKSTSQFFPLWLLVASLCHAPTHSLICITTIVAGDPEGSTSPAPIFFEDNYSALVYLKRKKDKRKRKLAAFMWI